MITAVTVIGCANPVSQRTGVNYAQQAEREIQLGNWNDARRLYARAITNGKYGGFDDENMAYLWYQYSRASGVICDWEEAERGFGKAYELDRKIGGSTYVTLYELGQMNLDRGGYDKAVEIFKRTYIEMENVNVRRKYPIRYSTFLISYADALEQANKNSEANKYRDTATVILKENSGGDKLNRRTPYGSQCKRTK